MYGCKIRSKVRQFFLIFADGIINLLKFFNFLDEFHIKCIFTGDQHNAIIRFTILIDCRILVMIQTSGMAADANGFIVVWPDLDVRRSASGGIPYAERNTLEWTRNVWRGKLAY